ncbi:hypothetical protein [Rhizobium alvei]|uniref:Calcium-binding protein n=1 Tax=Rhizobium alvei TaxID=1132659 RepID=A0ABT8YI60_9HYPH|nr:hypothetical protein [Rhizobium alvei]MDO6962964.1 hypothetical protein [Rhizobium alvei]
MSELQYTSLGTKNDFWVNLFKGLTVEDVSMHEVRLSNADGYQLTMKGDFLVTGFTGARAVELTSLVLTDDQGRELAKLTDIDDIPNLKSLGGLAKQLIRSADSTIGTIGNDQIFFQSTMDDSSLYALAGNDRIILRSFETGSLVDGGLGRDILDFSRFNPGLDQSGDHRSLYVGLEFGEFGIYSATLNSFAHIDKIIGSRFSDIFECGDQDTIFFNTGAGDDSVFGGEGKSRFDCGAGDDSISGGTGRQILQFGLGSDHDYFADFDVANDRIAIKDNLGFSNFSELAEFTVTDGHETVIDFGAGDILTIEILNDAALTAKNFIF